MPPEVSGAAGRAADVRVADFLRLGFKSPFIGLASGTGKHAGFKKDEVIVSAYAKCGKILRAGLTGQIQPCGRRCACLAAALEKDARR